MLSLPASNVDQLVAAVCLSAWARLSPVVGTPVGKDVGAAVGELVGESVGDDVGATSRRKTQQFVRFEGS